MNASLIKEIDIIENIYNTGMGLLAERLNVARKEVDKDKTALNVEIDRRLKILKEKYEDTKIWASINDDGQVIDITFDKRNLLHHTFKIKEMKIKDIELKCLRHLIEIN